MSAIENAVGTITLDVTGMTCGSCERHVRKELEQVPGYRGATVDLATGRVDVSFEPGTATRGQFAGAVAKAGYPAKVAATSAEVPSSAPTSCGCCATGNA